MKVAFVTFALLGLAYGQSLSDLPDCATSCALNGITATGCAATDAKCVCSKPTFLTSVATCVQGACSASDVQKTYAFAQSYCAAAGITITTPGSSPAPATSAASSKAPASSSAPASSAPASASAASTSAAAASSAASTSAAEASSTASSAAASASSSSPAPYTGAAAPIVRGMELMVAALGVAAIAL